LSNLALPENGSLTLYDGLHETGVVAAQGGRLSLATQLARRVGRFVLIWQRGDDRIEIPVSGQVRDDGLVVELDAGQAAAAIDTIAGDSPPLEHALLRSALEARDRTAPRSGWGPVVLRLLAIGGCLALCAYDGLRIYHAVVSIVPRAAYLATEVSTINSPTSGKLAFAADPGNVAMGEPVLGIENVHGKTILVDATQDVRIIAADKKVGERVKRGDPLLAIADRNPPVYLVAIVTREQAFDLSSGAQVLYSRLEGAVPDMVSAYVPGSQFELTALPEAPGAPVEQLYQVRFRVADTGDLSRAAPVTLEFRQSLRLRFSEALSKLGVPADLAATLLKPLDAMEGTSLEGDAA